MTVTLAPPPPASSPAAGRTRADERVRLAADGPHLRLVDALLGIPPTTQLCWTRLPEVPAEPEWPVPGRWRLPADRRFVRRAPIGCRPCRAVLRGLQGDVEVSGLVLAAEAAAELLPAMLRARSLTVEAIRPPADQVARASVADVNGHLAPSGQQLLDRRRGWLQVTSHDYAPLCGGAIAGPGPVRSAPCRSAPCGACAELAKALPCPSRGPLPTATGVLHRLRPGDDLADRCAQVAAAGARLIVIEVRGPHRFRLPVINATSGTVRGWTEVGCGARDAEDCTRCDYAVLPTLQGWSAGPRAWPSRVGVVELVDGQVVPLGLAAGLTTTTLTGVRTSARAPIGPVLTVEVARRGRTHLRTVAARIPGGRLVDPAADAARHWQVEEGAADDVLCRAFASAEGTPAPDRWTSPVQQADGHAACRSCAAILDAWRATVACGDMVIEEHVPGVLAMEVLADVG